MRYMFIVMLMMMGCAGSSQLPDVVLEDDAPIMRIQAVEEGSRKVDAEVSDRSEWLDTCRELVFIREDVEDRGSGPDHSLGVTAEELKDADEWVWNLDSRPEEGTSFLADVEEEEAWLCGVAGDYRIEVSAYRDGVGRDYYIEFEVR